MPFYYSAYGLSLGANQPIPGLVPLAVPPEVDVDVRLGVLPRELKTLTGAAQVWRTGPYMDERGEPALRVWKLAGGKYYRLLYSDGTEFVVDGAGTNVWTVWPATLTLEDAATYFLGPVLGFVLRLRHVTCLHASAVAIGDGAIALVGPPQSGKSTSAAAFSHLGYWVLSEDVVALDEDGGTFFVQPGYPRIRLWPESVNALYGAPHALPRLTPTWDKCYLDLTDGGYKFQGTPLPLAAIYVLGERCTDPAAPLIERTPASAGLIELVANTYTGYLLDDAMRRGEFESLARIAASVPVRRVKPHADPGRLFTLCDTILDDFQGRTSAVLADKDRRKDEYV